MFAFVVLFVQYTQREVKQLINELGHVGFIFRLLHMNAHSQNDVVLSKWAEKIIKKSDAAQPESAHAHEHAVLTKFGAQIMVSDTRESPAAWRTSAVFQCVLMHSIVY